jgi:undecaprenyl-diphosphatase
VSVATAAFLGLVQGLTEFVPISSKTHLVVVPALFGMDTPSLRFIVLLHAGTLVALVLYFLRDLLGIARDLPRKHSEGRRLVGLLVIATIPAAVVGKLFEQPIEDLLTKHKVIAAFALLLTAALLVGAEWLSGGIGKRLERPLHDRVGRGEAIIMGVAQAFALLPGISRSGSTMGSGLASGLRRDVAARFSFLMSIPIIFGADLLELPKVVRGGFGAAELAGFTTALISGFASVAFLLRYLRNHSFLPFAAYCGLFAVVAGVLLWR